MPENKNQTYLEPTQESGRAFITRGISGSVVMLVRQRSVSDFMAFASNQEYLAGIGHRVAALEDSRLLPIVEGEVADVFNDDV